MIEDDSQLIRIRPGKRDEYVTINKIITNRNNNTHSSNNNNNNNNSNNNIRVLKEKAQSILVVVVNYVIVQIGYRKGLMRPRNNS